MKINLKTLSHLSKHLNGFFTAQNPYAWEKCKLGEVANIIMGQSPSSEFYTNNPSDYILVQGNADIKNGWVTPRIWTTQITKMGKKGDLIFSVRAPVGEIGKTKYDVVLGRGVAAIQGNEFIFQTLGRMNIFGFWKSLSTGSTFDAINSSELKNVEIHLPTLPEQQKIGALFRRLDRLITLHKRKLLEKYNKNNTKFLQNVTHQQSVLKLCCITFNPIIERTSLCN
ncbi:restriction endonuclease subunit S [Avibacterium paragallinarum]|uniref:restriction endonuclease subunit S n=1 Tax=Avibacterium paragallinarum TaxID=728 RepID=UPI00397E20BB